MKSVKITSNHLYFLTRLSILLVLFLTLVNFNKIFADKKVLGVTIDTTSVQEQKNYYQKLVSENPTYIDGYVELSKIESFLGNTEGAKQYLLIVQRIDPNRELK